MPGKYAADTSVPVSRSREELERILARFGADSFAFASMPGAAVVAFRLDGRLIRIRMAVPAPADPREERRLWRVLVHVTKAKLVSVEEGVATLEEAFLDSIVLPDDRTVGEWLRPQIAEVYATGQMPALLPGVRQ